jgi:peptidoglycan/xylan/chitin deacetylase (PgdA/CDA1 family)
MSFRHKILTAVKMLGGFSLAQTLTRQGLQVLCYHGISLHDEHYFQPKLFMKEDTFRERMAYLKKSGIRVLSLDKALAGINQKTLPPKALVITFDDGWLGIGTKAAPVLKKYGFPSTLYVTTRDVINEAPVFDVTLRYLLWKKRNEVLDLGTSGLSTETIVLSSSDERERAACHISEISKSQDDNDRLATLLKLAKTLDIDLNSDKGDPLFRLMTMEQLAQLPSDGMDLQLHTHCHRLPVNDPEGLESEIVKNRSVLERIVHGPLQHLCYPSGKFHPSQFPLLQKLGVKSATTCLSGFNYPDTERFALRRFLDGENITQLEFEAELSGFLELMRKFRRILSGS